MSSIPWMCARSICTMSGALGASNSARLEPREQIDPENNGERTEAKRVRVPPCPVKQHIEGVCEEQLRRNEGLVLLYCGWYWLRVYASAYPSGINSLLRV